MIGVFLAAGNAMRVQDFVESKSVGISQHELAFAVQTGFEQKLTKVTKGSRRRIDNARCNQILNRQLTTNN